MKRRVSLLLVIGLISALALPAGAKTRSTYGLAGEARALDLALLERGVTLGLALTKGDSVPKASGLGAGQCTLLGDLPVGSLPDLGALPCTSETTVISKYPGNPGSEQEKCGGSLPAPLNAVLDLKTACGLSTAGLLKTRPSVKSAGKVAELTAQLPVDLALPIDLSAPADQVAGVVDELTGLLAPVLEAAPVDVRPVVDNLVDNLLQLIENLDVADLVKLQLGTSTSDIIPRGRTMTVESSAAGAKLGVLGLPSVNASTGAVTPGDALTNGLIIVEVGTATASATVDNATSKATGAASAALATIKVRNLLDLSGKSYIEIPIAPAQTITLLEGTPLETTIVAADTQIVENADGARAAADAVRVHALKGIQGGVKLGLGRATAAVRAATETIPSEPPGPKKAPPTLPVTGVTDYTAVALMLLLAAGGVVALRRKFASR